MIADELKYFFFLFGQLSFPEMVWPTEYAPDHLCLKEVKVRAKRKVFQIS
jgi:hypothetical protein